MNTEQQMIEAFKENNLLKVKEIWNNSEHSLQLGITYREITNCIKKNIRYNDLNLLPPRLLKKITSSRCTGIRNSQYGLL